jgi:hypothetical protein
VASHPGIKNYERNLSVLYGQDTLPFGIRSALLPVLSDNLTILESEFD